MLKTDAIFGDGMILQRNSVVAVFGETDCNRVEVQWCGDTVCAEITQNRWIARIKTGEAAGPLSMSIKGINDSCSIAQETIDFKDILLGEVWLAGGQSNMELELKDSQGGEAVAAESDFEQIRFYNVPKCPMDDEELLACEAQTSWKRVRGEDCRYMSAVAYHFATMLYSSLKVPIGIVDCYWGGTSATCWAGEEIIRTIPEVKGYIDEWEEVIRSKSTEQFEMEMNDYNTSVDVWIKRADELKSNNPDISAVDISEIVGPYPWPPPRGKSSAFRPFGLHKTMISRVAPYTVKGFIYYQAEEDCDRGDYYSKLNSAVIKQWRQDFAMDGDGENIPFYITQLPMFISAGVQDDKKWCILREQQELTSKINKNVGIAVICDCGEYDNIHPINKKTPGYRLAEQVLDGVYHNDGGLHNFAVSKAYFDGNRCELTFEDTYGQLCYRETDGTELTGQKEDLLLENGELDSDILYGFEISNNERDFYAPQISVEGDTLILSGDEGCQITDVRYGWFNYGVVNLYSGKGIPLMPFWKKIKK